MLNRLLFLLAESQHSAGTLADRNLGSVLSHTHHGAAGNDLVSTVLQTAAGVEQAGNRGADGALDVLGLDDAGAGHGDDLVHHGHTGGDGAIDGAGGVDVEHSAANVGGQTAGRHLLAGDGLAQLLFTALGVTAVQRLHHDGSVHLSDDLVHGINAVLLVVLDADDDLVNTEHLGQILAAADDLFGTLQHGAMVARDVGFALSAVDQDVIDLADTAGDLHVSGERCAAHTHDTSLLDDLHHLFNGQSVRICGSDDFFADSILEIVLDDHGHHVAAHGIGTGLNSLDFAGNTCVDRSAQATELADLLTHLNEISHLYQGSARCAKVHRHGDDHLCRGCQLFDGLFIGRGFHVIGMNAAKESVCHCLHLIFTPDSVQSVSNTPSTAVNEEHTPAILPHTALYSTPKN